jgi:hypothetical protein
MVGKARLKLLPDPVTLASYSGVKAVADRGDRFLQTLN